MDVAHVPMYLLDTNMAAFIVSGRSLDARQSLRDAEKHTKVALSTVSQAELLFGLENKPQAIRLRAATEKLLRTLNLVSWDQSAAVAYGRLRAQLAREGKTLSAIDMLIAAHAHALGAILVTHDKAFQHAAAFIQVVDWATDS